jgi:hypothetical protein
MAVLVQKQQEQMLLQCAGGNKKGAAFCNKD